MMKLLDRIVAGECNRRRDGMVVGGESRDPPAALRIAWIAPDVARPKVGDRRPSSLCRIA
jgi:hypothetical protein